MSQLFTECDHQWNWRQFGSCPACETEHERNRNRAVPISAETLKEITDALEQCITDEGATARKSHARAMQRLHYISEVARAALAKVRT